MTGWTLPMDLPHSEAALSDAGSESAMARFAAAMSLSREDGARRGEAIAALARLVDDPVEEVRSQAVEGLAAQAGAGAEIPAEVLWRALDDRSPLVRCSTIEALALVEPLSPALAARLLADPSPAVRATAARALGDSEGTAHGESLAGLLADPDPVVRRETALALCRIGDARGEVPALEVLADGGDLALEAASALGELGGARSAGALRKAAAGWLRPVALRAMAAAALARCGDGGGREILARMLGGSRSAARLAALGAMARLPVAGMAPAVGAVLDGRSSLEASAAVGALSALAAVDRRAAAEQLERRRGRLPADLDEEIGAALEAISREGPGACD